MELIVHGKKFCPSNVDYVRISENIPVKKLRYITYDNWNRMYLERDLANDSSAYGTPDIVYPTQDKKFGLTPVPNKSNYTIQYEYWKVHTDLSAHGDTMDLDDRFNFGLSISNIGPKIDFVDVDQADPSPTNMRLGIFAQLYNDGHNKVNFLFDANKLLVSRYQMMDWDGDGKVGGYDEFGTELGPKIGEYNEDGKKEYDDKGYMDDPWYLAIATAWLDDWYFGGDIDHDGDRQIGGWSWSETDDENGDGDPDIDELIEDDNGVYGKCVNDEVCLEKGTGESRTFTQELNEMVYNVGMEYWYTDAFALRAGYIHDFEGKIFNPTFGAGIRLLQYGFDFGYTAGEQGHPRANTMFFSVNIKL